MKRAGAEAPALPANQRESTDDRDARMELRWVYDRRGERSTLAFVAVYQDELAEEFFSWRQGNAYGDVWAALEQFEAWRFAAPLDRVSHGMLRFAVRYKLDQSEGGKRHRPDRRRPLGDPMALTPKAPGVMVTQAAKALEMPRRLIGRALDNRVRELQGQAEVMREPGQDA